MDLIKKITEVLNEGEGDIANQYAHTLKANNYIEDKNKACNNCEFYEGEPYEGFGACKLVFPGGVEEDDYSTQFSVENYGSCDKFKLV